MSLLQIIHGRGTLAARPAASAANEGYIYSASDAALYRSNGSSWDTIGGNGIIDTGTLSTYLDVADQGSDPASPASGKHRFYAKAGGLYVKDSGGTVVGAFGAAGGGATIAYPSLKPATPTHDFTAALSGFTAVSTAGSFAIGNCFAQAIDGSHLLMGYTPAQGGFIYEATSNVDQEWIVGGLMVGPRIGDVFWGIGVLDTSNDGVALIVHAGDNTCAIVAIAGGVYTVSPSAIVLGAPGLVIGSGQRLWLRLTRVGNAWDGYYSLSGAGWDVHAPSTMSRTITASRRVIGNFNALGGSQLTADYLHAV